MIPFMTRVLPFLLAAPFLASCSEADEPATPEVAGQASAPLTAEEPEPEEGLPAAVATFESVLHDFGRIDDTRTVSCEFPFVNEGSTTLNVTKVKASCGCTTTELAKKVLEPGEGDVIRVDWKPKGTGQQQQTVDVITDSPTRRATRLTVKAQVKQKVTPEPRSADFGEMQSGATQALEISLTSETPGVEVLSVQPALDLVQAHFTPNEGGPETLLGVVDVQITPLRRGGFSSNLIATIRVPADQDAPEREYELKIPVRASVFGSVQTEPDGFYVGVVPPGGSVDYKLRLRRPDGTAFGMTTAEVESCTVEGLTIEALPGDDEQGHFVDLMLRGPVGEYLGTLRGQTRLLTDIEGDTSFTLPIMGMVRE
jgi:hypothetical protein